MMMSTRTCGRIKNRCAQYFKKKKKKKKFGPNFVFGDFFRAF